MKYLVLLAAFFLIAALAALYWVRRPVPFLYSLDQSKVQQAVETLEGTTEVVSIVQHTQPDFDGTIFSGNQSETVISAKYDAVNQIFHIYLAPSILTLKSQGEDMVLFEQTFAGFLYRSIFIDSRQFARFESYEAFCAQATCPAEEGLLVW